MFGFQISAVPRYGVPRVLASSFLLGQIGTEKGPGLPGWYYWVLILRGCSGRDQDLTEIGTAQKQNKNAGHGSGSFYVTAASASRRTFLFKQRLKRWELL